MYLSLTLSPLPSSTLSPCLPLFLSLIHIYTQGNGKKKCKRINQKNQFKYTCVIWDIPESPNANFS